MPQNNFISDPSEVLDILLSQAQTGNDLCQSPMLWLSINKIKKGYYKSCIEHVVKEIPAVCTWYFNRKNIQFPIKMAAKLSVFDDGLVPELNFQVMNIDDTSLIEYKNDLISKLQYAKRMFRNLAKDSKFLKHVLRNESQHVLLFNFTDSSEKSEKCTEYKNKIDKLQVVCNAIYKVYDIPCYLGYIGLICLFILLIAGLLFYISSVIKRRRNMKRKLSVERYISTLDC